MKALPRLALRPVSSPAKTFGDIETIRARLEEARRAESAAIRNLGAKVREDRAQRTRKRS